MKDSDKKTVYRDLRLMLGCTIVTITVIVCFMFFSPFSVQFEKENEYGLTCESTFRQTYTQTDYQEKLTMVDSLINIKKRPQYSRQIAFTGRSSSKQVLYGSNSAKSGAYNPSHNHTDYQQAVAVLDMLITKEQQGLPRFAYFDRYLSETERAKARIVRTEIYDLQWKRIQLLKNAGSVEELNAALRSYKRIVGYHQKEAKDLYRQLNEN